MSSVNIPQLNCPKCGAPLQRAGDLAGQCFVCLLESALEEEQAPTASPQCFGHYQVVTSSDGTPLELGRGAMGVTYKAFDLDLQYEVTLKVISEKYLGDESMRLRFLREARAAASLRHPNVASVFHLGKSGANYFYAMEFVEGETLESLIKRSGRLEVKLALEITAQVAAGLSGVNKQKLVHRDIKPSNIMVNLEGEDDVNVKIVDLGLAKAVNEPSAQTAISTPGGFAGTPEFASPEQFAGIAVDIRSDLYSLGVSLWQMLTGKVPFSGSPTEVMYQHQHTPLPVDLLKDVPQPIVVLLEVLLAKDPSHRFQTPIEFLKALPLIRDVVRRGLCVARTIRVFVSSTGDLQKERHVAEQIMRSVAADFNLPLSHSSLNFQRLVECDTGSQDVLAFQRKLVLCPCFWHAQCAQPELNEQGLMPDFTEFDLVICIVWSRLGTLLDPSSRMPDGSLAASGTAFEIAWTLDHAKKNNGVPDLQVYHNRSKPTPPLEPKEEREAFGRQWDAVQDFFGEKHGEQIFAGNLTNYSDLERFEDLFRGHFRDFLAPRIGQEGGQKGLKSKVRRWKSSPFRGLNIFSFEHASIFHGRTKAIGEVLAALEEQIRAQRPFVLVLGASGSGKSSLVQAGVLPLLTQSETIQGISLWRWAVTRPGAGGGGGDCFDALAAALLEPHGLPTLRNLESRNAIHELASELRDHSDSVAFRARDALDHAAREWKIQQSHALEEKERQLRDSGRLDEAYFVRDQSQKSEQPKARLALVVDQLEELFTSGFSLAVQQKYITAIDGLVRSGRVIILATLRSDFYPSYQEFPALIELTKPAGKFDLRAPTPYEIGNMIRLPAEAGGLHFEQQHDTGQRLDQALCDAASAIPESLPLLEHVLSLLYDEQAIRGDDLLRWSDYRDLGELQGALARHAEAVFGALQTDEQKAFPLVMRHLVTLSQGEEELPNRRTVPYRDFVSPEGSHQDQLAGARGFVDLFVKKRLLVADTDPQGEVTVCVAHEALLREWQRIKSWLVENREFLRMRQRLDSSLKVWQSRGRQKDDLLGPGLPLAEGQKLVNDFESSLSREQTEYVYLSIAERNRRTRAQKRIRYAVMTAISVLAVVAGFQWFQAERQRRSAEKNAARARQNEARSKDLLREASKVDFVTATQQKDPAAKLAYLARAVRQDPSNQVACISLEQLITKDGSFPKTPVSSFRHEASLQSVCFSSDGKWVLTASADHTARVWETASGKAVGEPLRHGAQINMAVFSPDGLWVATASDDGTGRLWDAASGKATGETLQHGGRVNCVAFSSDGKWVVTASDDGTARLWDVPSGKQVRNPFRHDGFVYSADISPDRKWVVTTSSDQTARVWEAASGKLVGEPLRHDKDVWHAVFSPDGKWVVTASSDHTARVWKTETGEPVGQPLRHTARVNTAVFSPDGRWVVTSSEDHTGQVWEAATGKTVGEPLHHDDIVSSASFSPDGEWVVTASADRRAQVWEAETGKPEREPLMHDGSVTSAAFSSDGKWILTAGADRAAHVWKATTGKTVSELLRLDGIVRYAAFSRDGNWILTGSNDRMTQVWEAATGKVVGEPLRHDARINAAVFSPDGKRMATASSDGTARVWVVSTGQAVCQPLRHNGGVSNVAFSPDAKWVVTASWDGTAQVWETATGKSVGQPLRHNGAVNTAAFSPDGRWVVTASADRKAQMWEAATGLPSGEAMQHEGYVWQAAFSPDGKWVVTASADGTARLWEALSGKPIGPPLRHDGAVKSAAFSDDGKWIVTASEDGTGRVWEAATGKEVGEPLRHDAPVNSSVFSPDGNWVLTASADHTSRVWEAATGKPVGEPMQHDKDVWNAIFSPNGKRILTASSDWTARLWEAPLEEPFPERLLSVVRLLPKLFGHLDFDANGFLKPVPNSRVSECRDQMFSILQEPELRGSSLVARIQWSFADERTRSINPTSRMTVPQFAAAAIEWRRTQSSPTHDLTAMQKKKTLKEAYELDPAFPLIHLALAALEPEPERAVFLREFDLQRLPESCKYTNALDPAEITLEAAEMCADQNDWPRALVALEKYAKVGVWNSRSEALRARAQSSASPQAN